MKRFKILCFTVLVFIISCKDPYDIPLRSSDKEALVVDGFLNMSGPTVINLSSAFKIDDTAKIRPVLGAQLTVEGNDNTSVSLTSTGNGRYTGNVNFAPTKEYRLRIKTTNGKEYLSDYVKSKITPLIDSLNWKKQNDGVMILANTHDNSNNTRYYRWDFEETWEISSYYLSLFKYVNETIVERDLINDQVYTCWKSMSSPTIVVGSSAQLQSDVIFEQPVAFIPPASEKLSVRYSILVKQYAIHKDAYEYFKLMKTNTESLGSIFDPQPSDVRGNIKSLNDPNEPVIGFITVSDVQEKRIFINKTEVPDWSFSMKCESILIPNNKDSIKNYLPTYLPWDAEYSPNNQNVIIGWHVSKPECVDCTRRGGSRAKPSFW